MHIGLNQSIIKAGDALWADKIVGNWEGWKWSF